MKFKSTLEKRVYDAIKATGSFTSGFSCMKEYPWTKLFSNSPKNKNAVDFYFPDLDLVIEVNGEQHYQPVSFGEKDDQVVLVNHEAQKLRDRRLRRLCEEANVFLLELHYNDIRERNDIELNKFLEESVLNIIGV